MKLSVIIPAYNEAARLPKTLWAVHEYLTAQDYSSEIIVVSDGSRDETPQKVRELGSAMRELRLIDNPENRGKGYVVRQGMLAAKGEYRVFMDADNATTIDHVEKMWPLFAQGCDVVIGSRDIPGAILAVPQTWIRRRLGDVFNLIVQVSSGLWGIWDTQCGFKGFSADAVRAIFPQARIDRWAFDVELLVLARKQGRTIREIPVRWVNDPHSTVQFGGMIRMLGEALQIRWNMIKGVYHNL